MEIKNKAGEYPTQRDAETIEQADDAAIKAMMADATRSVEELVGMMEALQRECKEVVATLCSVLSQACGDKEGNLDSMAVPAYADGLRLLATHYKVAIQLQAGPYVLAKSAPCDRSNTFDADGRARTEH